MPKIVELDALEKIVKAALYSAYVEGEKPLSLLIVAKPESAKTAILKKYRKNKGIVYITDCTGYGLTRDVLPKIISGEVNHILIPDLITPLSKSTKTRQTFIAFLNNLIEEGIAKMTTYATIWEKDVRCGLITAVTNDVLARARYNNRIYEFLRDFGKKSDTGSIKQFFEKILQNENMLSLITGNNIGSNELKKDWNDYNNIYNFWKQYYYFYLKFKHGQGLIYGALISDDTKRWGCYLIPEIIDERNKQIKLPISQNGVPLFIEQEKSLKEAKDVSIKVNEKWIKIRMQGNNLL